MASQTEVQKWAAWQSAEDRAAKMWADRNATAQQCQAATWEAQCAKQQWSDAADEAVARKAA